MKVAKSELGEEVVKMKVSRKMGDGCDEVGGELKGNCCGHTHDHFHRGYAARHTRQFSFVLLPLPLSDCRAPLPLTYPASTLR